MCRSDALRPVRILVFVQTALPLVFTYSDSSRGEHCGRSDLVNNKVARIRVRALFTGLLRCARNDKGGGAMTRECVWRGMIEKRGTFLHSLTTPPLRGTPP